jgi:hypothetical protein
VSQPRIYFVARKSQVNLSRPETAPITRRTNQAASVYSTPQHSVPESRDTLNIPSRRAYERARLGRGNAQALITPRNPERRRPKNEARQRQPSRGDVQSTSCYPNPSRLEALDIHSVPEIPYASPGEFIHRGLRTERTGLYEAELASFREGTPSHM